MSSPVELYKNGNYLECINAINSRAEQDTSILNLKGVCYMRQGNAIAAIELFESVLAVDAGNTEATANMKGALMLKSSLESDTANQQFR